MKKTFLLLIISSIMALSLAACGSSKETTVTPTATSKPILAESEVSTTPNQIKNEEIKNENTSSTSDSSVDSTVKEEPTPEPTATSTPVPTATSTPVPTATSTPVPTATSTPVPTATSTPVPTATSTPVPTATSTPVPTNDKDDNGYKGQTVAGIGEYSDVKIPVRDSFNYDSLNPDNSSNAFKSEVVGTDFMKAWMDAYWEFNRNNGSPQTADGKVLPAFQSFRDGYHEGYSYLYYGTNWGDYSDNLEQEDTIYLWLNDMSTGKNVEDCKNSYIIEYNGIDYADLESPDRLNEYRSATLMLLSYICTNPSEVENFLYESLMDTDDTRGIWPDVKVNGAGHWVQVGKSDVRIDKCVMKDRIFIFRVREHK